MSSGFENRLFHAAGREIEAPDPGEFVDRLHRSIDRRRRFRQRLALTLSSSAVLIIAVGLYFGLGGTPQEEYIVNNEFVLFSDVDESADVDVEWVDSTLILHALNYLIQEADLAANGWNTVGTLNELGYIEFQHLPNTRNTEG